LIKVLSVFLLALATPFPKTSPASDAVLVVRFVAYVHGEPLQLDKPYKNSFGEVFEISRFRFYVGKLKPVYSDAWPNTNAVSAYHLIDFSDSISQLIELPVRAGACNGIQFQLGIDSADQGHGAQTGPLDPVKGMFWTWNSGYLSFKIEGSSPSSNQPAHTIAYHIGGYREPYSTIWNIRINTTNDDEFRITKENKINIEVPVDLGYFFDGPTPLHIRNIPACTTPGELARKISENFIGTFTGLRLTQTP
jgi:hypothetical protein